MPLGVAINTQAGSRVWNTFDAHRLLHWAERRDREKASALKQALFRAYFTDNENVADRDVLVHLANENGLDGDAARRRLESDQ
jgi:predicted DsbA family dithiol-disulfide isomerase